MVSFKILVRLVLKDIMTYDGRLLRLVSSAPLGEAGEGGLGLGPDTPERTPP